MFSEMRNNVEGQCAGDVRQRHCRRMPFNIGTMNLHVLLGLMVVFGGDSSTVSAQEDITTTFEFDNVSNRVGATGLLRLSDPAVLAASPSVAFHGDVVNIFGRNLEPGVGTGYPSRLEAFPRRSSVSPPGSSRCSFRREL